MEGTKIIDGTVLSKAYEIDFDKTEEGHLACAVNCYAENYNKAKVKLLKRRKT